jgi:hypothetical protein
MIRCILLLFFFALPAFAQSLPSLPPADHFECWRDSITEHFTCMSAKGSILDVEDELNKLDRELTWGNEGNGGGDLPTRFLAQDFEKAAQKAADETDGNGECTESLHRICRLRQVFKQGEIETYTLDCIP